MGKSVLRSSPFFEFFFFIKGRGYGTNGCAATSLLCELWF
jgi:hypothetical protein